MVWPRGRGEGVFGNGNIARVAQPSDDYICTAASVVAPRSLRRLKRLAKIQRKLNESCGGFLWYRARTTIHFGWPFLNNSQGERKLQIRRRYQWRRELLSAANNTMQLLAHAGTEEEREGGRGSRTRRYRTLVRLE